MMAVKKSVELENKYGPMSVSKMVLVHEIQMSRKDFHTLIHFFFESSWTLRDLGEAMRNVYLLSTTTWLDSKLYIYISK